MGTSGLWYDDYTPQWGLTTTVRQVSQDDVVAFLRLSGMDEALFTDADFVQRLTPYDAPPLPGLLVQALAEGLVIRSGIVQGTGLAFLGGDVRVEGPTYVGDELHVEVALQGLRRTSKPGRGIVTTRNVVRKQDGTVVMVYQPSRMVRARESA